MAKALLIAEKPDLMRKVKSVYERLGHNDTIDFVAFHGHSMGLKLPKEYKEEWGLWRKENLPMIPDKFEYKPIDTQTFNSIKKKIKEGNYDYLINCCDPDREGQHIFHSFYTSIGCKLPVKRMWHLDLTDTELKNNLDNLKDDLKEPMLYNMTAASKLRAVADWLVGMNFTTAFSLNIGQKANIGRVMTPTLKILTDRELDIRNFVPTNFWEVESNFGNQYKGVYFDHENENNTKFLDKNKAKNFIKELGKQGIVEKVEQKKETKYAPNLYSLASIQVDANKVYGFTVDETLRIVQSLYEKQLLSYPRTDCSYLSTGEAKKFPSMLSAIKDIPDVKLFVDSVIGDNTLIKKTMTNKKYVDDKKVTAHYAIIPTGQKFNYNNLPQNEQKIMLLVAKRLISIFLPPIVSNKTTIITDVNGKKFNTTGSVIVDKGFSVVFGKSFNDNQLPPVKKGDTIDLVDTKLIEKVTSPPQRYTDATLIPAMENAGRFIDDDDMKEVLKASNGIGTPATRSNIIDKLVKLNMIERKKKAFYVTEYGVSIIQSLGAHKVASPIMTADWEEKLRQVESNELKPMVFYNELMDYIRTESINMLNMETKVVGSNQGESIGVCPVCGTAMKESKDYYMCSKYKNPCTFIVGKTYLGAKISKTEIKKILEGKSTKSLNFHNPKTNKSWSCGLKFDKQKQNLTFDFNVKQEPKKTQTKSTSKKTTKK